MYYAEGQNRRQATLGASEVPVHYSRHRIPSLLSFLRVLGDITPLGNNVGGSEDSGLAKGGKVYKLMYGREVSYCLYC